MAMGSDNTHTPWAQMGLNPSNYFDMVSIPEGFRLHDPSHMGLSVKELINHLRNRQEDLGVKGFRFHHVLKNQKLEPAQYPPEAMKVVESGVNRQSEEKSPKKKKVKDEFPC
jgi:hypothetical protein